MPTPVNWNLWTHIQSVVEACLHEGFVPHGDRGAGGKGSAVEEARRRLLAQGHKTAANPGFMAQWVKVQERRANAGREHRLPNWALFRGGVHAAFETSADRQTARDAKFWREQAGALRKQLAEAEHELREVSGLMERPAAPPSWTLQTGGKRHRAAGLLHLSDLHVGEVVRPEEIGGLNEYNPDVFVRRIRRCFSAAIEILPRWSADCDLKGVVVAVNGDLVSGSIHDELCRTNALTSHEQVYLATDELCAGVRRLADAFKHALVVFTPGNHGRVTEKTHAKRVAALNYDTLIGENVRRHFDGDKAVTVNIAAGADAVYPVLGWTVMQSHGDALGTGGGRGFAGPVLPIARGTKSVEWQGARVKRQYDVILTAHFHHKSNPFGEAYANSSMVGYSEFANRLRAGFEVPQQWLLLLHEKWCVREQCSIKLEDPTPPAMPRVRIPAVMERA